MPLFGIKVVPLSPIYFIIHSKNNNDLRFIMIYTLLHSLFSSTISNEFVIKYKWFPPFYQHFHDLSTSMYIIGSDSGSNFYFIMFIDDMTLLHTVINLAKIINKSMVEV